MPTGRKLNIGFIGAGQIAELHALAYLDNPTGRLYAIADIEPGLAERRRAEWAAEASFTDYRDLLADPAVDAVEIILPHHLHLPVTVAALAAGKHVSLQKPMCLSLQEADAIIAAAERSDRLFRVFENFRAYEPFRLAKSLVDADEIGELLSLRMKVVSGKGVGGWTHTPGARAWRMDTEQSGGHLAILDHGYHLASIAVFFMGPIEKVHTMAAGVDPDAGIHTGSPSMITFKFAGGEQYGSWESVRARDLLVRTKQYPGDEWVEVTGTRGIVWVNRCSGNLLGVPPVTLYRDGVTRHFAGVATDWADSFVWGGHEFTDAIANGTQPELDAAEARHILAFCLAAIKSGAEHREVTLAELEPDA